MLLRKRETDVLTPPRWFKAGLLLAVWLGLLAIKTWMAFHFEQPPFIPMLLLHKSAEALGVVLM
ncbi:hypothetical protein [Hymenobacter tenuis]